MKNRDTFQFMLVLKNVDENTPHLEDDLYEAGCDDALVNYRNGAVYLEFSREATSLEEAVVSAIKDVKTASTKVGVSRVSPENLVTEAEIAKRLNVKRQTVSLWVKGERRKGFPPPVMRLSEKSPLWQWDEVAVWLFENKIIKDRNIVEGAIFIVNINAALGELDKRTQEIRHRLVRQIGNNHQYQTR